MEVLLQENVSDLGLIGDIVKVKNGYALNYLIPRNLAVVANKSNKAQLSHQKRVADAKKQKALVASQELAEKLNTLSLTIAKPVGEEDRIFGTVTTQELADAFKVAGYNIERRAISILEQIHRVGVYKGAVKIHPEVTAQFNIWVVAQS